MSGFAVEWRNVRKTFGKVVAVDRVDLAVAPGTFLGLIGHNGAGKSTCLEMLMGLLQPTEGQVLVAGVDVVADPRGARAKLGAVPEEPGLYDWLTAREWLELVAEIRGGGDVRAALEVSDLGADSDRLIREYSQGMRRRTALAAALLGDPAAIVLDEALNGLDPPSAARIKGILRDQVKAGRTVILSTHVVETVQAVADRVVMLAHGRVVADARMEELGSKGLEELFLTKLAETHREGRKA